MRTTISIPDELFTEIKAMLGERAFSDFAGEAIRERLEQLKRESLAREMEAGYRAEAESSSLDEDWTSVELDGL